MNRIYKIFLKSYIFIFCYLIFSLLWFTITGSFPFSMDELIWKSILFDVFYSQGHNLSTLIAILILLHLILKLITTTDRNKNETL